MSDLRPYQRDLIDQVAGHYARGVGSVLLQLGTGGGKCLAPETPVLRFDGRIVRADEVRMFDTLMGPDGTPRTVLGTTRGKGEMFEIQPVRGVRWRCNDVHILTLVHTTTGEIVDVPLNEYLGWNKTQKHVFKQFAPPTGVDFAPAPPLPIDPYFLGIWLGDGSKDLGGIRISKPDPEIRAAVGATAEQWGLRMVEYTPAGKCPTWTIRRPGTSGTNPLTLAMRALMPDGACVPLAYRTASRADRLELLAGLLDTDGYLHNGSVEIAQKSIPIAEGIAFVARSLGFRVSLTEKIVNGSVYQRMGISGDFSAIPMRIPRKQGSERRQKKCATRTGFKVVSLGVDHYAGFELDGDGRFLLGDFTVTHNTHLAASLLHRAVAKGNRCIFTAHLDTLVEDTHARLTAAGVVAGYIQAGRPTNPEAPVQVCSTMTLHARGERPPGKLVIVDEAHRAASSTTRELLSAYPNSGILGLSATPQRGDGQPLDMFEEMVSGPSNKWLTAAGFLVPSDLLAPGRHQEDALAMDPVAAHLEFSKGKRNIVFAATKEHAHDIANRMRAAGITADVLVGETNRATRRDIRARLRSGELEVLVGVAVFLEGFDEPSVETVTLARPFGTVGAFLQAIGRGLRPSPTTGKRRCTILDLRASCLAHGLPDEDRTWSLTGEACVRTEKMPALMRCSGCFAVFRPARCCPRCGQTMGAQTASKLPRVLSRAEKLENYSDMPQWMRDARYLGALLRVAEGRMGKSPENAKRWAVTQFKRQHGRSPEERTQAGTQSDTARKGAA